MKIPCMSHGVHFGDEVDDIVACPIVWKRWGMEELPAESKRELTEWFVQVPADKIWLETGWGIGFGLFGELVGHDNAYSNNEEYRNMSEVERREWQRNDMKQKYEAVQTKGSKWRRLFRRKK